MSSAQAQKAEKKDPVAAMASYLLAELAAHVTRGSGGPGGVFAQALALFVAGSYKAYAMSGVRPPTWGEKR